MRELVDCGFGRDFVKADPRDTALGLREGEARSQEGEEGPAGAAPECPGGGHECHNGADDRPLEGPQVAGHILPDVLAPGLRVVFCGTAAGEEAARVGAPYAGPGNRFWWVLHEVGLTPRELRPVEFRELLAWGIGLTDVAKHAVGGDSALRAGRLRRRGGDREGGAIRAARARVRGKARGARGARKTGGYGEQE